MSGMEASLASAVLKIAGDKLVPLISSEFAAVTGVEKDLSELQDIHEDITKWFSTVRESAMKHENGEMPGWVIKLRNVTYDIEDLLDEVHLQAMKHDMEIDDGKHAIADCFCVKPKSFLFRYKVARKIKEIKTAFAAIVKHRRDVDTVVNKPPVNHPDARDRATEELSLLTDAEESKIPQRDQEKDNIVSKLLESSNGQSDWIYSIVGIGGSGKTTMAKHICQDDNIKVQFKDSIFMVHVSEEFSMKALIGKLFEAITRKKSDLHANTHMVQAIEEKLRVSKFLLVLDDAWHKNKDEWKEFMKHVNKGAPGSKILLTTRDHEVAEAVESSHIFDLAFLSEAESWSLFLKSSGLPEENLGSEHIKVGKEIVNKCGGVPLAIKTFGGVLSENRNINTWKDINESYLWNDKNLKDKVFTSLKLSYIHLAPELKPCFAYCSIFPKGTTINKGRLINQWIAHGFIHSTDNVQAEDIGCDYFECLLKMSFLQDADNKFHHPYEQLYKMHDLIHDLTQQVLLDEGLRPPLKNIAKHFTHRCRYLSLNSCNEKVDKGLIDKVRALYVDGGNPCIEDDKPFKKGLHICSVSLYYPEADTTTFPVFILNFKYLGYLEICNLKCTELPEAISGCWNLKALHLIYCSGFVALPKSVGKLKKLRTLEMMGIGDLESLPQSLGDCQDLQVLQLYSCGQHLKGIPTSIYNLENLRVLEIVRCGGLTSLPSDLTGELINLQTLNMYNCYCLHDLPSTFATCHTLRTLILRATKITMLPEWVPLIGTLECIDLESCSELMQLPKGLANLRKLVVLNIRYCSKLSHMPSGFGRLTGLRKLGLFVVGCGTDDVSISELGNLEMISGYLEIRNLKYLKDPCDAEKACLKKKKIEYLRLDWSSNGSEEMVAPDMEQYESVLDALEPPSRIKTLDISYYGGSSLPRWMRKQTDSPYCEGIMSMQTNPCQFMYLSKLFLHDFSNLKDMKGLVELPFLKFLVLERMPNLEELWTTTSGFQIGEEELQEQHYCFPVLSRLDIKICPKLGVKPHFPPSLQEICLFESNEQLLSPESFSRLVHPLVDEHPSDSCTQSAVGKLKTLEVYGMGSSSSWEFLQYVTSLESLTVDGSNSCLPFGSILDCTDKCPNHGLLPKYLGQLRSLRGLDISYTPLVHGLTQSMEHLTSLVSLEVSDWPNLKELPDTIQHLTSLETLSLCRFDALTVLPECIGQLSTLRSLWIQHSHALECLPQSIKHLTALEDLDINWCYGLAKRYKKEVGPDWHLISHIPRVKVSGPGTLPE